MLSFSLPTHFHHTDSDIQTRVARRHLGAFKKAVRTLEGYYRGLTARVQSSPRHRHLFLHLAPILVLFRMIVSNALNTFPGSKAGLSFSVFSLVGSPFASNSSANTQRIWSVRRWDPPWFRNARWGMAHDCHERTTPPHRASNASNSAFLGYTKQATFTPTFAATTSWHQSPMGPRLCCSTLTGRKGWRGAVSDICE